MECSFLLMSMALGLVNKRGSLSPSLCVTELYDGIGWDWLNFKCMVSIL